MSAFDAVFFSESGEALASRALKKRMREISKEVFDGFEKLNCSSDFEKVRFPIASSREYQH